MSDTAHVREHLVPGREYTRNITVQVPLAAVGTIGIQAERIRLELGEEFAEHEILSYELVVRVAIKAGGESDGGGRGEEASGDDGA